MLVVSCSRARHLPAALLCLCSWMALTVEGLTITVNNGQIPVSNDNMTRISVYDFEFVNSNGDTTRAIRCRSELPESEIRQYTYGCHVGDGDSPLVCAWPDQVHIPFNTNSDAVIRRGWSGMRVANEGGHRVHYLWRRSQTPEEGYLNCYFPDDTNPLLGLYVLYPITEVTAAIEVEVGTSTFRVRCTSTGGRALNMAVSGPNGYNSDISTNIQAVGTALFLNNDSFTARTEIISSGMAGDVFHCDVTSFASNFRSVTLRVATAPTLDSLVQIAPTAVRVTWSPPSETSLTGYRVRYSLSGGSVTMTYIMSSTTRDISGLTNGETYTFSVEVITSNMLPGVSDEMTITLAPDIPKDVATTAESSRVTVSWGAVDDANRYTVTFSKAQRTNQEGLCPTDFHTATLTVRAPSTAVSIAVGGVVGSTVTDILRAYTTYEVTVEAVSDVRGTSRPSETRRVLTPQTSAREAPGDVRAEAESSTDISVQWSGLSNCGLVNGQITKHRVQYTACNTMTEDYTLGDGEDWNSEKGVTLTGLTPSTNYSISVAAVNENGDVGLYSDPVTTMTHQCKVCSCESAESSSSMTGMIVGVVIGLLGVAVGVISGLIGGAVIAKRHRPAESKGDMATGANPAYGMSGPHGKPAEIEGEYAIPQYPQPPSGTEGVYEGVC